MKQIEVFRMRLEKKFIWYNGIYYREVYRRVLFVSIRQIAFNYRPPIIITVKHD